MKKVLFILLLIFPILANAKNDLPEHQLVDRFKVPGMIQIRSQQNYMYAKSFSYENGVYTLIDPNYTYAAKIRRDASPSPEIPIVYTCKSEDEISCEVLYGVYCNVSGLDDVIMPIIELKDGEAFEDKAYLKIGDSFHKDGKYYRLDNTSNYLKMNLSSRDSDLIGKYFCSDFTEQCEEILYIVEGDRNGVVVYTIDDDIIVGNSFEYHDGEFSLTNIVPSKWPNYEEYVGNYTCFSKETSCKELYQLNNYIKEEYFYGQGYFDTIDPNHFEGTKIDIKTESISINKGKLYDVATYLKNASRVLVENEKILKIEENKIVPLEVGKTNVLIQKEKNVFLLNVEITEQDLINPNTGHNVLIIKIICTISLIVMIIIPILIKVKKRSSLI